MSQFLYFLVVLAAILGSSRQYQGNVAEEEFCVNSFRNERLRNSCLQTVRANSLGVSSGNVSMSFTNCSKAGPLTIKQVLFNATPALNASFGVYLVRILFSFCGVFEDELIILRKILLKFIGAILVI